MKHKLNKKSRPPEEEDKRVECELRILTYEKGEYYESFSASGLSHARRYLVSIFNGDFSIPPTKIVNEKGFELIGYFNNLYDDSYTVEDSIEHITGIDFKLKTHKKWQKIY